MANPEHVRWLLEGVGAWNQRRAVDEFRPDLSGLNIGAEFRAAGQRVVSDVVELCGINLIRADLSGAVLDRVNLEGAKFFGSDLSNVSMRGAVLRRADFTGADLSSASTEFGETDLSGATFWLANMAGSSLVGADLSNADLWRATLHDADLRQANCENANFSDAELSGANLVLADLAGASLLGTRLWEAVLYSTVESDRTPHHQRAVHGLRNTVHSIEDLISGVRRLKLQYPGHTALYFRGEPETGWSLRPSVMRDPLAIAESEMMVDLVSRRPEDFGRIDSALGKWVLAQHHGLKTRFLDVTKNALVALFHACAQSKGKDGRLYVFAVPQWLVKPFDSDTVCVIANFARLPIKDQLTLYGGAGMSDFEFGDGSFKAVRYRASLRRLYALIRQEKPYFEERIDVRDLFRVFVVEPQQSSERLRAQSGAFLASGFHTFFDRDVILSWNDRIPVYAQYSLTVPQERKSAIFDGLRSLNVTRETLFPSLDSSVAAVTQRHTRS